MGVVATGETAKQLEMMEAVYHVSLGPERGGSAICMMSLSSAAV